MDISKMKLLTNSGEPANSSDHADEESFHRNRAARQPHVKAFATHFTIAVCYIAALTMVAPYFLRAFPSKRPSLIYTPARDAMKYKVSQPLNMLPHKYHDDPFFGDPSPELDKRWLDRLKYATIRLSEDEFRHYNQSGVELGDGTGYLATPTAYHDLHCLRALHKALYSGYYFPGEDITMDTEHGSHWRHCLHNLASATMCNVDMTIRIMRWYPNTQYPSPVDHEHECVDWDTIDSWAKSRYVDTSIPGLVVHP